MVVLFPPKSKFSVDQIPDLTGKVIIVTGGNTGIGKETCKALLAKGAKVYLAARSAEKAKAAIADLSKETGREAIFLELDLASLASVRRSAEEFKSKEESLHVLFNNGGVMVPPLKNLTADGYDLQFGTNVLGHYFFTKLLLPTLIDTAKRTGEPSRVIITSSSAQEFFKPPIKYESLKGDDPSRKKLGTQMLYCQSKFGNVIHAVELTRRYSDQGIIAVSLDPGNIQSDLQRWLPGWVKFLMDKTFLYPTPFGALSQLYAGTMPEGLKLNGKFLVPWARVAEPQKATQDPEEGKKLWNWLEEQVKEK